MELHKNGWASSRSWSSLIRPAILIALVGLIGYRRVQSTPPELIDFYNAYYPAGRLILEAPERLYSFAKLIVLGFVNLPIIAYLFTPFSLLDEFPAGFLFTLVGVVSVVTFVWWLIRLANLKGWRKFALITLVVVSTPTYYSIWLGNTTHTVFLFVLASFLCARLKRDFLSGAFLAIAGLLKIPLLFPILYFILRRRWQALKGFVATLIGIVGLSILVCGFSLNWVWFEKNILSFSDGAVIAYNNQSVDSFLLRFLTNAPIDSWELVQGNWQFKLLRYGLFLLLIGGTMAVILCSKKIESSQAENLEFSSILCLGLLISPISWTHYYILLLLPIALYLGGQLSIPRQGYWLLLMGISILLISTPHIRRVPFENPVLAAFTRYFLVSHFFLGGTLLLGILLLTRYRLGFTSKLLGIRKSERSN